MLASIAPAQASVRVADVGEAVVDERMSLVVRDAALLFCLARTALTPLFSVRIHHACVHLRCCV